MNGMNKPSVKEWTNKNFLFLNNAALLDTFAFYNDKQSATVRYLRFTYLITVLTYLLTYLLTSTHFLLRICEAAHNRNSYNQTVALHKGTGKELSYGTP